MAAFTFSSLYAYNTDAGAIASPSVSEPIFGPPFTVTITGDTLSPGATFTIQGVGTDPGPFTVTYEGTNAAGDMLFQAPSDFPVPAADLVVSNQAYALNQPVAFSDTNFPCFLRGTLIRTPKGDVAVENLREGDVVVTNSGERRRVKWIGHRDMKIQGRSDARLLFPVRIAAGAFGPDRPARDLYVSPGHSICLDLCGELLIPAGLLVNGATIAQVEMDEVSYWHVELDSHDIILANSLPAESYLVMENRGFFKEAGATLEALDQGRGRTHADFCRPVVLDGPTLEFVRNRLKARAEALGWTPSRAADLRLVVDGGVRRPIEEGEASVFVFPAAARDVRLLSDTFTPALVGDGDDPRELGLCVFGISLSGSKGEPRSISLDDERLKNGFHIGEAGDRVAWRWTKGELILDPDLWTGLSGAIVLLIAHNRASVRRWDAPRAGDVEAPPEPRAKLRVIA